MSANLLKAAETRATYILEIIQAIEKPNIGFDGYKNKDIALRDANEILGEIQRFIHNMHNHQLAGIKYYTARIRAEVAEKKLKDAGL